MKIELFSIVKIIRFHPSQSHWDKNRIGKLGIVSKEDEDRVMITFFDTGNISGWYEKNQLKLVKEIDSIKIGKGLLNKCNQVFEVLQEIEEELIKLNVLVRIGIA